METAWRIELFGGLRAVREQKFVSRFRTRQTAALLAYLALHPEQEHSRELLIDRLWPEACESAGRNRLSQALGSLRRQLELPEGSSGSVFLTTHTAVSLRPGALCTDVAEFEESLLHAKTGRPTEQTAWLERAISLYKGDLLPGFYDDWIILAQQRLSAIFDQALADLAAAYAAQDQYSGAIESSHRLLERDPTHPTALRILGRLRAAPRPGQSSPLGHPCCSTRDPLTVDSLTADPLSAEADHSPAELSAGMNSQPLPAGSVTFVAVGGSIIPDEDRSAPSATGFAWIDHEARRFRGVEISTEAGKPFYVFQSAASAAVCAIAMIEQLPERGIAIALDTVECHPRKGQYPLSALQRTRCLVEAAHPGQILCSAATGALLDQSAAVETAELGVYRVRGIVQAERLYQVSPRDKPAAVRLPLNAEPGFRSRLPAQLTRFVGRENELDELLEALDIRSRRAVRQRPLGSAAPGDARLITLVGTGGCGKTRLAVEAAEQLVSSFLGDVWFAPLAEIQSPEGILPAIAGALGAAGADSPLSRITIRSGAGPALIVLDNLEHLLPEGALTVETLLREMPRLRLIVTSRRSLGIEGERTFQVNPLPVPDDEPEPAATKLRGNASVQLFVERAQAARPDFQVTDRNAPAVAKLCRRLEGIPLALELAAARALVLGPTQILEQLERGLDFLASRSARTPRHRSLRGAMDWSYQLLAPDHQRFFAALSVFRGGWSMEAAAAVCLPEEEPSPAAAILERLEALHASSLVIVRDAAGSSRFEMLETLREYAAEQLLDDEAFAAAERHARYYLHLAETAAMELDGIGQYRWMPLLIEDEANLRTALEWAFENDSLAALRAAGALGRFWQIRGAWREGLSILERALCLSPAAVTSEHEAAYIRALHWAGGLAWMLGVHGSAIERFTEKLARCRAIGDHKGVATGLIGLANASGADPELFRLYLEQAIDLSREMGYSLALAMALNNLGLYWSGCQKDEEACVLWEEAVQAHEDAADPLGRIKSLFNLADFARRQGDLDRAETMLNECLDVARDMRDTVTTSAVLSQLGAIAQIQEKSDRALSLYDEIYKACIERGEKIGAADALAGMAAATAQLGDHESARELLRRMLRIRVEQRSPQGAWMVLVELGREAARERNLERAVRFFAAGLRRFEQEPGPAEPYWMGLLQQEVEPFREQLGEAGFDAAWTAGESMTWDEIIALALPSPAENPCAKRP